MREQVGSFAAVLALCRDQSYEARGSLWVPPAPQLGPGESPHVWGEA